MAAARCNTRYLPQAKFPDALIVVDRLEDAVAGVNDILIAVPSHALRSVLIELAPLLSSSARLAWATKGFELDTGLLPHQVAKEILGTDRPFAVLSGPTFAQEVGQGLPTAMTIASADEAFAQSLAQSLSADNFRAYTSSDIVGVEVGGAIKNVLAVGAGLADGLGFGANTRVALITRGLVEMTRLGVALGAQRETFMGLAGLGDLVLTCTDDQSRNRRFGLALAAGKGALCLYSHFTMIELGGRLRYEFAREFAPYVGIHWERKVGRTAQIMRAGGENPSQVSAVAGIRFFLFGEKPANESAQAKAS